MWISYLGVFICVLSAYDVYEEKKTVLFTSPIILLSSTVTDTIVQQWLAWFFNSHWHDCWTVTGTNMQQWLARFFNSRWYDYSTVVGTIVRQSLARLFNSHWHDSSTVTVKIFVFSMLAEFFSSDVHCWRIVPCTRNTTHDPVFLIFPKGQWFFLNCS